MAQSPVGGAGLEFRAEDARGPLLSQPAGPADRGGGLDPVCRGERRPNGPADRLLVAAGTGGGETPPGGSSPDSPGRGPASRAPGGPRPPPPRPPPPLPRPP